VYDDRQYHGTRREHVLDVSATMVGAVLGYVMLKAQDTVTVPVVSLKKRTTSTTRFP
jgi:hypothetical protein